MRDMGGGPRIPPISLLVSTTTTFSVSERMRVASRTRVVLPVPGTPRLPQSGKAGFVKSGFPAPHIIYNSSWHLSTFMSPEDVLHKLAYAAHTECNRAPFNSLAWQRDAQSKCFHFCKEGAQVMRPVAQPSEMPADAYPDAICAHEYRAFAPGAWCTSRSRPG